eukprot:268809-Chlamydomonas_euryale.AAC.1
MGSPSSCTGQSSAVCRRRSEAGAAAAARTAQYLRSYVRSAAQLRSCTCACAVPTATARRPCACTHLLRWTTRLARASL